MARAEGGHGEDTGSASGGHREDTGRDAVEGQGPQRRLHRRLEEVAEAVGMSVTVGYECR